MISFSEYCFFFQNRLFKYLYKVGLVTFKVSQISLMVWFLASYMVWAVFCFVAPSFGFRPPLMPRFLAAFKPAWVLSTIRFLSNSDKAPKMWKISFPVGLSVSMLSCKDFNTLFLFQDNSSNQSNLLDFYPSGQAAKLPGCPLLGVAPSICWVQGAQFLPH